MRIWRICLAVAIVCAVALALAAPAKAKTLLVVDSYHAGYPWSAQSRAGFIAALSPTYDVRFFELDTKRTDSDMFWVRIDEAWDVCRRERPDLVVLMDDNSLRYLGQRISDAGIPVVFMGINGNPRHYFRSSRMPFNVSGVLERPLILRSAKFLAEILPTPPRNILLMLDDGFTSEALIENSLKGQREHYISGISIHTFQTGSSEAWMRRVRKLGEMGYDAVLIGNCSTLKDETGRYVPLDEMTEWTAAHSSLPVFAFWRFSVGKGKAIGGLLISGRQQGVLAAKIVDTYMTTKRMPPIIFPRKGGFLFSRSELSRWKLEIPEQIKGEAQFVD